MSGLFVEAERKIKRASDHISELEGRILEFEERFMNPTWEHLPFNGIVRLKSPIRADEVDYLSEVMGDALHCLRASLDRMAVELVRLSKGNPKSVYFPMGTDATHLEGEIERKHFDRAGADAVELLRGFAPHAGPGGNILARTMHDHDVTDKHKGAVKTVQLFQMPTIFYVNHQGIESVWANNWGGADVGQDPCISIPAKRVNFVRPAERTLAGPIFNLEFPRGVTLGGRPVVPALHEMAGMTRNVVQAFAALFRARN